MSDDLPKRFALGEPVDRLVPDERAGEGAVLLGTLRLGDRFTRAYGASWKVVGSDSYGTVAASRKLSATEKEIVLRFSARETVLPWAAGRGWLER